MTIKLVHPWLTYCDQYLGLASWVPKDIADFCNERDVEGKDNLQALRSLSHEWEEAARKTATSISGKH